MKLEKNVMISIVYANMNDLPGPTPIVKPVKMSNQSFEIYKTCC